MRFLSFSVGSILALTLLVAGPAAGALIPAGWNVDHLYTLGDAEGGVIGNTAVDPAIDSGPAGADLPLTGTPVYAAGVASPVAVDFTNAYGTWPTVATDYYSDPTLDFNPADPSNWGLSFDVLVDSLPGPDDDQEVVLVNLGSFAFPSLMIQLFQGEYVVHLPGSVFAQTGIMATVGGWDHVEFANINGTMDLEVNGAAAGLGLGAGAYDPSAGLTIGAVFANGTGGVQYARGVDAVIDQLTISNVPEPTAMILALLGIVGAVLIGWRRK